MTEPEEKSKRPRVPLPVVLITFVGFWGLGGYLFVAEQAGAGRWSVLGMAFLCFAFPILSFEGIGSVILEGLQALFRRLGGNGK